MFLKKISEIFYKIQENFKKLINILENLKNRLEMHNFRCSYISRTVGSKGPKQLQKYFL